METRDLVFASGVHLLEDKILKLWRSFIWECYSEQIVIPPSGMCVGLFTVKQTNYIYTLYIKHSDHHFCYFMCSGLNFTQTCALRSCSDYAELSGTAMSNFSWIFAKLLIYSPFFLCLLKSAGGFSCLWNVHTLIFNKICSVVTATDLISGVTVKVGLVLFTMLT